MTEDRDTDAARLEAHRRLFHGGRDPLAEKAKARAASAAQHLQNALAQADRICAAQPTEVDYQTLQRSGFKHNGKRRYTLSDARRDAEYVARELRTAWELMDPIEP